MHEYFIPRIILLSLISIGVAQQLSFCLYNDETPAFLLTENYRLLERFSTISPSSTKDQCQNECANSDSCASFEFTDNAMCRLSSHGVEKGLQLQPEPGVSYYKKICLPAKSTPCTTVFIRIPQKILIGHVQAVHVLPNMEKCLEKCLQTVKPQSEFNCESLLYYYRDKQCILNSETRNKLPDLFVSENATEEEVDYVEYSCTGWSRWEPWSRCQPAGHQARFRQCNLQGTCEGSGVETRDCEFTPEPKVLAPPGPPAGEPQDIGPGSTDTPSATVNSNTVTQEATPSYVNEKNNECHEFKKLGYDSYGDCLRNHYSQNSG